MTMTELLQLSVLISALLFGLPALTWAVAYMFGLGIFHPEARPKRKQD